MKLESKVIVGMLALLVCSFTVYAIGPADVTWVSETNYLVGLSADSSDETEGGNITVLNLVEVNSSTRRWAGYLGDITAANAAIILSNPSLDIFYDWAWDTGEEAVVCAGQGTSYAWDSLVDATPAEIDAMWSFGDASDDAEATFDDAANQITIGSFTSTVANSADTGLAAGFVTTSIRDANVAESDYLFCVDTDYAGVANAYDGTNADYELIVPITFGATETYYFYVELN